MQVCSFSVVRKNAEGRSAGRGDGESRLPDECTVRDEAGGYGFLLSPSRLLQREAGNVDAQPNVQSARGAMGRQFGRSGPRVEDASGTASLEAAEHVIVDVE